MKIFNISITPAGSNPAVGSSAIIKSGSIANIPARATLLFWPPDNSNGERFKNNSSSPTNLMYLAALSNASCLLIPKLLGPNAMSFSIVSSNSWYSANWNTTPTLLRISLGFLNFFSTSRFNYKTINEFFFFACFTVKFLIFKNSFYFAIAR